MRDRIGGLVCSGADDGRRLQDRQAHGTLLQWRREARIQQRLRLRLGRITVELPAETQQLPFKPEQPSVIFAKLSFAKLSCHASNAGITRCMQSTHFISSKRYFMVKDFNFRPTITARVVEHSV